MKVPDLAEAEFRPLRDLVEQWCGIALDDQKHYLLESRLRELVMELGCESYSAFYEIARNADEELRDRVVDAMTTNETSWFRDESFAQGLRESILPQVAELAREAGRRELRIWSAACSTGQEPYSISILAHELMRARKLSGFSPDSLKILATDISPAALLLAERGWYDPVSMNRGMEKELAERYFDRKGRLRVLKSEVRKAVEFRRLNLLDSFATLGRFDLVLMRNVLIYFSNECKERIVGKMRSTLYPGGSYVIGATESLEHMSHGLQGALAGRCAYYRSEEG